MVYLADWNRDYIIIPLSDLKDTRLSLYVYNSDMKVIDFVVPPGINIVNIYANNPINTHIYNTKKAVLKRRKSRIKAIGMWTKKRRTLFVRREEYMTH
jgi:hypothetical protein